MHVGVAIRVAMFPNHPQFIIYWLFDKLKILFCGTHFQKGVWTHTISFSMPLGSFDVFDLDGRFDIELVQKID